MSVQKRWDISIGVGSGIWGWENIFGMKTHIEDSVQLLILLQAFSVILDTLFYSYTTQL